MKFKIHRGTKEIGGSCVEISTINSNILIDFGMPLVDSEGGQFSFKKYEKMNSTELVSEGILPNIDGLYDNSKSLVDGILISHAHLDHYGLGDYVNESIPFYLSEATHKIIELGNIFTPQNIQLENFKFFTRQDTFTIGDFSITPYWMDHSAFDSYSFLIEADGKRVFYSGDFRSHGRKVKYFKWFLNNAPKDIDYLIMEGTTLGRDYIKSKTEEMIENELFEVFKSTDNLNAIYTSGQNIDRLVSIYKACLKANRILVVDVYIAKVLKELSKFAKIPFPSPSFNIKVIFPYYTSNRLTKQGNESILFEFSKYKVTKEEISENISKYVMVVRPSMIKDLDRIKGLNCGNIIYSMWNGYLKKDNIKELIDYFTTKDFKFHNIHTSGHADKSSLIDLTNALKPRYIIPIHTFNSNDYKDAFLYDILPISDEEEVNL